MGTTKPKTAFEKTRSMGSRTGLSYEVEDFPSAGFVVVRAADGSEGVFQRKGRGGAGFLWARGRGHPNTLAAMRLDFGAEAPAAETPKT